MPKDKCIICNKPCVGRFCYRHIAKILNRKNEVFRSNPAQYIVNVNAANASDPLIHVPLVKLPEHITGSTTFKFE
jgi:hypothetical protein